VIKRTQLNDLTTQQLVERFLQIALQQYDALQKGKTADHNRLYDIMEDVKSELKQRPGDQRNALLPLLDHTNAQVRLKAAYTLLAISPIRAKKALETVRDSRIAPQSVNAGFMLEALADGSYVPS
jgi:5-bromo-4-chloroindolyl phosphate hydrolysis protein